MIFLLACGIANVILIAEIIVCKWYMGVAGIDILYRYKVLNLLACLGGKREVTTGRKSQHGPMEGLPNNRMIAA